MTDVVTLGETMAAVRTDGLLRLGGPAHWSIAGAESTVAIGLARLGHSARWIGRIGADEPGALVLRTLRAENVDTSLVRIDPDAPTGLILFETRVADTVRVNYYRGGSAGSQLSIEDVDGKLLPGTRILHLTGITPALGPGPAAAVLAAIAAARAVGAIVCLDVNYRSGLWSRATAASALRPLLGEVDILIASVDELGLVTPAGSDAAAGTGAAPGVGPQACRGGEAGRGGEGGQGPVRGTGAEAAPGGAAGAEAGPRGRPRLSGRGGPDAQAAPGGKVAVGDQAGPRAGARLSARGGSGAEAGGVAARREGAAAAARPDADVAPGADAARDGGVVSGGAAGPSAEASRIAALLDAGVREVVVTCGAAGAWAVTGAATAAVPARQVPVADPVGAGDAFAAGYLSAVLDGLDLDERLRRAVTTAAFAVATRGDWEGLPTRAELALLDAPPGTTIR